jgi:hypothetical protein
MVNPALVEPSTCNPPRKIRGPTRLASLPHAQPHVRFEKEKDTC